LNILRVDASGRREGSSSRALVDHFLDGLASADADVSIRVRDLAETLPHVDEQWIQANFTAPEERTEAHERALALSDRLVDELKQADILVIGTPVYNFGVPAALKAWVDLIARARLTFRYTENGPQGLLGGKRAVLVVASGGVAVDGEVDFATPYLRQALKFVGITEVDVIAADRQNLRGDEAVAGARSAIDELVRNWPWPTAASQAA
jgi:FMN-dependent NADH-azoreductase